MPIARYLADAARDLRYAVRQLRHRPGFALAAILPLALGLGAATAMYSVVDGVMLRPLPFAQPDRLTAIWATEEQWRLNTAVTIHWDRVVIGMDDYVALRDQARSFSDVAAWSRDGGMLADASGGFAQVGGIHITHNMLDLLGIRPVLGRGFTDQEDVANGPAVALLSWEAWQQSFGGDPAIVGRSISYNERPLTVVGIMPAGIRLDRSAPVPAVWTPGIPEHL